MYKLLQINVTANSGSTGKIAEAIGQLAINRGWESWIAYGRGTPQSESRLIRIGNDRDMHFTTHNAPVYQPDQGDQSGHYSSP